jgi:hypothetical protein
VPSAWKLAAEALAPRRTTWSQHRSHIRFCRRGELLSLRFRERTTDRRWCAPGKSTALALDAKDWPKIPDSGRLCASSGARTSMIRKGTASSSSWNELERVTVRMRSVAHTQGRANSLNATGERRPCRALLLARAAGLLGRSAGRRMLFARNKRTPQAAAERTSAVVRLPPTFTTRIQLQMKMVHRSESVGGRPLQAG